MSFFRRIMMATCASALILTSGAAAQPAGNTGSPGFPIPFWYSMDKASAHQLESMVKGFQAAHPYLDIQTRNFATPEEMYRTMEKGQEPMFAIIEGNQLARLDESTDLTTVEDWMPRDQFLFSWSVKHDVYGALFKGCSVNDRLMARPFYYSTEALIYNPEILEKVGVKAPPQTWEQVDEIADKVKAKEPAAWGFGFRTAQELNDTLTLMLDQQEQVEPTDSLRKVVEFGQELAQTAGLPDEVRDSCQLAMRTGTVADYLEMRAEGLPVRVAGVPGPDAAHRRTEYKVWGLGMFPVAHEDLYKAQEFAFWLMDFNQQREWAQNTPYLSAHVKVFDNPFYRQARSEDHNNLRVFVNLLGRADMAPFPRAEKAVLMDKLSSVFPQLVRGEIDSAAAMKLFASIATRPAQTGASTSTTGASGSVSGASMESPR